jgi:hypothetical protein
MQTAGVLVLVAVLSPVVAFGAAWAFSRAIRESATANGARLLALITVVVIQLFVLASALHTYGVGRYVIGTVFVGAFLTWQAWSQLKRVQAVPRVARTSAGPSLPAA